MRQMQEAHAERAKNGMMQMTKEVLEAEIADNPRTPTLITVSNDEDSLVYVWVWFCQMMSVFCTSLVTYLECIFPKRQRYNT